MNGQISEWMDGKVEMMEWVDGWMVGQMDELIDGFVAALTGRAGPSDIFPHLLLCLPLCPRCRSSWCL